MVPLFLFHISNLKNELNLTNERDLQTKFPEFLNLNFSERCFIIPSNSYRGFYPLIYVKSHEIMSKIVNRMGEENHLITVPQNMFKFKFKFCTKFGT